MELKREMKCFLLIPKTIQGKTKWLIFAKWQEERELVKRFSLTNSLLGGIFLGKPYVWEYTDWKPTKWL